MTYIPMQDAQAETNNMLERLTKQLRAILKCLSSMSGLNITEEDV